MIDTSTFPARGREVRGFRKEVEVDAPASRVFDAWTTAEGWRATFDVRAKIELRIGGAYEIYFDEDVAEGQKGSEGCQVLAWVPDALVVFSWNAPPGHAARALHAWVAVRLDALSPSKTRVTLDHLGFGEGPDWDLTYAYFDRAWGKVLARLATALA